MTRKRKASSSLNDPLNNDDDTEIQEDDDLVLILQNNEESEDDEFKDDFEDDFDDDEEEDDEDFEDDFEDEQPSSIRRQFNLLSDSVSSLPDTVSLDTFYVDSDGEEFTSAQVDNMMSSVEDLNSPSNQSMNWSQLYNANLILQRFVRPNSVVNEATERRVELNTDDNDFTIVESSYEASGNVVNIEIVFDQQVPQSISGAHSTTAQLLREWQQMNELLFNNPINRRLYSRNAPSMINLPNVTFTAEQYDMAAAHFNSEMWINNEDQENDDGLRPMEWVQPHVNILNGILEYWHIDNRTNMPSWEDIIEFLYDDCIRQYSSIIDIPLSEARDILEYWVQTYGIVPTLLEMDYIYEYYMLHHETYPTEDELRLVQQRFVSFIMNPDSFFQNDRVLLPTKNIQLLKQYLCTSSKSCSICQDDIVPGQYAVDLHPCHHTFHAHDQDCLESASIYNWLHQSNLCPLCKKEIHIQDDSSS